MASSIAAKSVLGELAKRVPNNQKKQFRKFLKLNKEYKKRVNKYPEKLPRIDWEYYRTNVRIEAIKMVDEFEKKYEELNKVFDDRVKLDTNKYYNELEKQRTEVQAQIKQYIVESNARVKAYEAEILRLCNMKPYSSMTMEEFINLRPECSNYIPHQRKPLFWPHDPDEQTPGPVGLMIQGGRGDGDGGGGDAGGEGGKHFIKPGDIKGDTASFEFKEVEAESMKDKQEATTKAVVPEKSPQAEARQEVTSNSVEEPKRHVDKPASKEEKQKLDPCGLIEKQDKKEKAEAATVTTEEKPRKIETPTEARKKPHPCDLVKGTQQSATKGDVTCETAAKGPYKDEIKRTCVFVDPCNVGFGKRVTAKVEPADGKPVAKTEPKPVKKKSEADKDASKSAANKEQSKPVEPKKTHPCDVVKKKPEPNQEICKSAATKGQYKDAKGKCVFLDPCNVGFGAGVPAKVEPAVEKPVPKTEPKPQPMEPKTTHPCEMVKKEPDHAKDPCKTAAKKEQPKAIELRKAQPCEMVKERTDPIKDPCKTAEKKEQAPSIEPKKTQPCEVVKKRTDSNEEICKGAAAKGRSKDEKDDCFFVDPCSVGFEAGMKADPKKSAVEKVATKAEPKPQPREPEKKHPCEVIKKKPDPVKDPCKSAAKKEQSQPREAKKTNPCEGAKKKADTEQDPCKISAEKKESQPKEVKRTNPCEVAKKKADTEPDPCKISAKKEQSKDGFALMDPCSVGSGAAKSTESKADDSKTTTIDNPCNWQPVRPKKVKKSQTCDDMIKDKDSCTMVFADTKNAKSDCAKEDKKKQSKSCGALPYYNPFRSEAENRKNEEKMCEESEEDDPCASDNIEEDYYNPCKDDKDDECE